MLMSARLSPGFTTNSFRSNSEEIFVSTAPIHCARQSLEFKIPIVQVAGWLHAEAFPFLSHTRTFQKTCWEDPGFFPS
jgi:hypothetical protein